MDGIKVKKISKIKILIIFFIFIHNLLHASTLFEKIDRELQFAGFPAPYQKFVPRYQKSRFLTDEIWESVKPYLLPENHPIKPTLDKIFSRRVTLNKKSLDKAGFKHTKPQQWSHTTVTKHKLLKGYIIKLFTDNLSNVADWTYLKRRIKGANEVQEAIDKFGYQKYFVVPKKWLYPLPDDPSPPPKYDRRFFILIAEKIELVPKDHNNSKWKGSAITKPVLDALYNVLEEVGLDDSIYPFNIPMTVDKKIAFIDTEIYHRWPVRFSRLTRYLSKDMRIYWQSLIKKGGPSEVVKK